MIETTKKVMMKIINTILFAIGVTGIVYLGIFIKNTYDVISGLVKSVDWAQDSALAITGLVLTIPVLVIWFFNRKIVSWFRGKKKSSEMDCKKNSTARHTK